MSKELWEYQKELEDLTNLNTGTLRKVSETLSDFEQTFKFLQEKKKSYIEDMKNTIWVANPKLSDNKCTCQAYASKDYKEFLEGYKEALGQYITFRYKHECIMNRIEILRSFISLEKEKLSLR